MGKISNAVAIAKCNAAVDLVDVGGTGTIEIRTGSPTTNAEDTPTGTLLGTLTNSATAFGNAADINPGARATANAVTGDTAADASGTAGYFRQLNGSGVCVWIGTITATGGGGDMTLASTSITAGEPISITSYTYTQPEG